MSADGARADARLAIPAVLAWIVLGVLLGAPELLWGGALTALVVALAAVGIALVLRLRGKRTAVVRLGGVVVVVALAAAVCGVLATSAAAQHAARHPLLLDSAVQQHRAVSVTATLGAPATAASAGAPLPATVSAVRVGDTELHDLAIPVLVFGGTVRGDIGTGVVLQGTLAAADAGESASYLLFARGDPAVLWEAPWYLGWANALRARFHEASVALGGDGGTLLPGLALGDTSAVDVTLDHAMKVTSLSHLTAVSGANCAIVVWLIMVGGGALGLSRRGRVVSSLLLLVAFVVLVTPDASVLRAAVMAGLVLAALARGRPIRGLPVLALAVIILLGFDPWLARDYGFILSVLATAGLLLLSGPLTAALSRWMPTGLAALIAIPFAAQLACQPVLILLNPAIPVYGVIANLLAEPAAPAATVVGLLACVGLVLLPPLGHLLTAIAWLPSAWIAAVARFFESAPGAQAPWPSGALGVGMMAFAVALILAVLLESAHRRSDGHSRRTTGHPTAPARRASVQRPARSRAIPSLLSGTLAVGFVVYCGVVAGAAIGRATSIPADWNIAVCDVGQGDAVLVRSAGDYALIDTGREPALLTQCLSTLGVNHLDLLVLTHYDLDHVGGTDAVLGMVDRALVGPVSDSEDTALRDRVALAGAQVDEVRRGATGRLGELRWDVLWPPERLGDVELGNAASVTVRFDGVGECASGCLSSLFLGDLGEVSQLRMLGTANPGPVDVVKVAHHGSADQSERLYERLRAAVGVIGVGADNGYGHPTDSLLDTLGRVGTSIARTDLEGMILLSPAASGGVQLWTEHTPDRDVAEH